MTNRSSPKNRPSQASRPPCTPPNHLPAFTEPEVRRWPHPVDGTPPSACSLISDGQTNQILSELHSALSHQIQLLTEIRSLLEQLVADPSQEVKEK